ncbi:MAG: putative glycoside hydrolase [Deltaproteobacteria bacterium]
MKILVGLIALAALATAGYFVSTNMTARQVEPKVATAKMFTAATAAAKPAVSKRQQFLGKEFRALYITSWTAGISRFNTLIDMASRSYLNAVVIDIKDSTGKVGYDSKVPLVTQTGAYQKRIRDLDAILKYCRDKKIYTIARIAVFQDPNLANARHDLAIGSKVGGAWKDRKGLAWVDPASREVWDYNIAIAKEAAAKGFDEVQLDYVRFPTDGKLKTLSYPVYKGNVPKHEIIRNFFQYVDQQLKPVDVLTSADIFGLTTMVDDDMNIGQRIQDVADYVDYVCPMIYPSHYPRGHLGMKNPAEHPYRVIYDASMRGMRRLEGKRAKMRPWLQDFKLGAAYDKKMILEQIQAARDAGVSGFSMWNARNVYTEAAYLAKLPEPNPNPPLKAQVVEDIRKHEAARAAMQNRSTAIKQEKPSIQKPRRKSKGA